MANINNTFMIRLECLVKSFFLYKETGINNKTLIHIPNDKIPFTIGGAMKNKPQKEAINIVTIVAE